MKCIFCQIIKREEPVSFIYEDDIVTAFLDVYPINEGHVLITPKRHEANFCNLTEIEVGHLFKIAQKILKAIHASDIKCEGANLFLSDGAIAGQEVMHSHLHIAPRFKGDGHQVGFSHSNPDVYPRNRLDQIAHKIKKNIEEE